MYNSADFVQGKHSKLIESFQYLSAEHFHKWMDISRELDIVHSVFLYSTADTGVPIDLRCAHLIEIFEPIEYSMLNRIITYFDDPYCFEQFACKLVQIMDSNIISIEPTRRVRDGGRDAVGQYRVGSATGGIELEFALEAKRYSLSNSVGVKETSRLISRIKHRQFGIFVTTSFVGDQAYKEIIEDQHPIVVVSGKDIVDILITAGINSVEILDEWLSANFEF